MDDHFMCPHCKGYLNVENKLIFAAKTEGGEMGLILLNSEVGNYEVTHNPQFDIEHGKVYQFFCPACHKKLTSRRNPELISIIMKEKSGEEFKLYFSAVAGEKSTFKVVGESAEIFGDDSQKYMDYFNLVHMS
jgi:hypothetical protein